ncbi:PREDICTED: uncharacterized protein LOC105976340 [Erythranthe guttata]|uniref:uncharacterized protein LOC105976340 n=1 Tax=Erythranthe guttata TaxID=4155 RepID=UPI00064D9A1B|nr:PREDICTED: uncharacterized protein LOC105976340 [Erythranthe guttata]|eukprot:XP_012857064.1 PREDICTED: uncharacterized protein LOC105976340 [Erythranthe guttata]
MEEGGLGIRPIKQVMRCLHGKLLWQVMKGDSLWARFAKAKYCDKRININRRTASPLWNAIHSHVDTMEECTQWIVGRGAVKFWSENWLGEQLTGPLPCDARLTVVEALTHIEDYLPIIPIHWHDKIRQIILDLNSPDRLIFTLTQNGEFSSKAYCNHIRVIGRQHQWADRIWSKFITPKTSGFMWKLMHHALPVDQRIISRGIPIVSRCVCCQTPKQEDINHLFFNSEVASQVWQ